LPAGAGAASPTHSGRGLLARGMEGVPPSAAPSAGCARYRRPARMMPAALARRKKYAVESTGGEGCQPHPLGAGAASPRYGGRPALRAPERRMRSARSTQAQDALATTDPTVFLPETGIRPNRRAVRARRDQPVGRGREALIYPAFCRS